MAEKLSEQFAQLNILDFEDKVIGNNLTAEATFCNKVWDIFDETYLNQKILFRSKYSRLLVSFFFFFEKGLYEDTNQKLARCVEEAYFLKKYLLKKLGWCANYRAFNWPVPFSGYRWTLIINFSNVSPNRYLLYPDDIEDKELVWLFNFFSIGNE